MTLKTYGLSNEEFATIVRSKAKQAFDLFSIFKSAGIASGFAPAAMDAKMTFDLFNEVLYAAEDEARDQQRKRNPERAADLDDDLFSYPSHQEIIRQIQELKAELKAQTPTPADTSAMPVVMGGWNCGVASPVAGAAGQDVITFS